MVNGGRITAACQQCRQRKRRCDGTLPCCNHCIKHERRCIYIAPRRRGPAKSKAANQSSSSTPQQRHVSTPPEPDLEQDVDVDEAVTNNELSSSQVNLFSKGDHIDTSHSAVDSLSQSPRVIEEIMRNLPPAAGEFAAFTADVRTTMSQMQAQMNQSGFTRKIFTHLPPKHLAVDLLQPIIESIQPHGNYLATEDILSLLDHQYIAGLDDCHSDPGRWAIVCAFLGMATLHRTANESLSAMAPMAWAFFKNAFATFAELASREPEISSCEALLAMASFMLRTANTRVAAQLIANAACVVHMLGLHREENYVRPDNNVAQRHKRVFWVSIHARFAKVVDWIPLAHGLLSNMPLLCGKTREVFAGIFESPGPEDSYGEFVPEFLKSQNYTFSFSA